MVWTKGLSKHCPKWLMYPTVLHSWTSMWNDLLVLPVWWLLNLVKFPKMCWYQVRSSTVTSSQEWRAEVCQPSGIGQREEYTGGSLMWLPSFSVLSHKLATLQLKWSSPSYDLNKWHWMLECKSILIILIRTFITQWVPEIASSQGTRHQDEWSECPIQGGVAESIIKKWSSLQESSCFMHIWDGLRWQMSHCGLMHFNMQSICTT